MSAAKSRRFASSARPDDRFDPGDHRRVFGVGRVLSNVPLGTRNSHRDSRGALGVVAMLQLTGDSLNLQSFQGAIMSNGVAMANAILLLTFAELRRNEGPPRLRAYCKEPAAACGRS